MRRIKGIWETQAGVLSIYGQYSDSIDLDDAKTIENPYSPNISIIRNKKFLSIEKRMSFDTIPLTTWNLSCGIYRFNITKNTPTAVFRVVDSNKLYPMSDTFVYQFTQTSTSIRDSIVHYQIIYLNVLSLSDDIMSYHQSIKDIDFSIYPNPTSGLVNLKMSRPGKYTATFYNINFHKTFSFIYINNVIQLSTESLHNGFYHVIVDDGMGNKVYKSLIIMR